MYGRLSHDRLRI